VFKTLILLIITCINIVFKLPVLHDFLEENFLTKRCSYNFLITQNLFSFVGC